ncbi:MAG: hypothetical protein QXJ62_05430 [Nitrososphaeria archaeon]
MSNEDIKRLKLFNEKAERLSNSRFMQYILNKGKISFRIIAKKGEEVKTEKVIPDQDAIDAFVLTFRYFIQNNERCSFGNLSETYEKPFVPEELRTEYFKVRQQLNEYLDSQSSIQIGEDALTRRRILDVFIYGGLAHANPKKKEVFDAWTRDPFTKGILEFHFANILVDVLKVIRYVAGLNEKLIQEIEKQLS